MGHDVFRPRTATREEKRQANEALGRSFCKTIAEPVTNSDSSAKRKLGIQHASDLIELMLAVLPGAKSNSRKTGGFNMDLLRPRFLHLIH